MSDNRELAGVLPVIQTPFLPDGGIDEVTLDRELNWVLDQGVAGLTTGMVTEILRLTEAERHQLTERVVGVAHQRGALSIISCGAESTKTAVMHAKHAEATGADGLMAIPPVTVALDDDALYGYYAEIADATTIGLVVQDASGYIGRPLTIEIQAKLLSEYGSRVYFKPEAAPIGPRLSMLRDATGGEARAFEGTGGAALIDSFRRGAVGTMPGAEVCWAIQRMWEALNEGDWARAYGIGGPLVALVNLQTTIDVFVAVEKHILKRQGVFSSTAARGPLSYVLDPESRDEVDRLFDHLSVATRTSVDV
ncbi:dihydrodipicolinate synthase family protein [Parafrigoribacterium humi]|uniref:dihydrodipicolinate synthase family protein n=1 Tax=Parafrigoribacterium humi TaxID=3144664 RepID=UPI0032F01C58